MRDLDLVAEPGRGRVFTRTIKPGIADADGAGRVRLDALARWLQDVAYLDLVDAGLEAEGVWILRRARLAIEGFPRFGETVELRTWCSGIGRFSAERRTTALTSSGRVESVAVWAWLDDDSLRPRRFDPAFAELYSESADGRGASVRLGHPEPPPGSESRTWKFRKSDLDVAGHVNNAVYLAVLEEWPIGEPDRLELEIEYHGPAEAGEAKLLGDGDRRWIVGVDDTVHASIKIG